ncbi:hypothetical protein TUM4433_40360 [Shewanella schlegeliana]|nr:hypothetical protein TUM4433_40360 [Shewanella schlegeliana]
MALLILMAKLFVSELTNVPLTVFGKPAFVTALKTKDGYEVSKA